MFSWNIKNTRFDGLGNANCSSEESRICPQELRRHQQEDELDTQQTKFFKLRVHSSMQALYEHKCSWWHPLALHTHSYTQIHPHWKLNKHVDWHSNVQGHVKLGCAERFLFSQGCSNNHHFLESCFYWHQSMLLEEMSTVSLPGKRKSSQSNHWQGTSTHASQLNPIFLNNAYFWEGSSYYFRQSFCNEA